MLNSKGIAFIHERTRPLAVGTSAEAGRVIADAYAKRQASIADGRIGMPDDENFAIHVAWLIGFDTLVDQRREIQNLVDKLVD